MFKKNIKWLFLINLFAISGISAGCAQQVAEQKDNQEAENPFEKQNYKKIKDLKQNLKSENLILNSKFGKNLIKEIDREHAIFALISTENIDKKINFTKISNSYNFEWNYENIKKYFANENEVFYNKRNNMILEILPLLNKNEVLVNLLFIRDMERTWIYLFKEVQTPDYLAFELTSRWDYEFGEEMQEYNNSKINNITIQDDKFQLNLMQKTSFLSSVTETKHKFNVSKSNWEVKLKDNLSALYFSKNIILDKSKNNNVPIMSQQRVYDDLWEFMFNNSYYTRIWSHDVDEYLKDRKKYDDLNSNTETSKLKMLAKSYLVDLNTTKLSYDNKGIINNINVIFENSN
ncbi:hypothetical protein BCF59_0017 [Mycoplasmopsis mustelae]|uniref:Lipoprotein n=1 Tax=Mycoplasmopsis mustelae TaxID=171289 RepID=A0A4R7UE20_9BACT|nr:hypothetical protein [Mycoplasmopsis mustelae]TDV24073.1 hypothetical protein BCF59_0017 [Mycoplasmopsis mustelae]